MSDSYYEITTAATTEPVTFSEICNYLRIDQGQDDDLIKSLLTAAIDEGEKYTRRYFMERTVTGYFSGFDETTQEAWPFVEMRRSPVDSITSFKSSQSSVWTDITATYYDFKKQSGYSRILLKGGSITADDIPYPLQVIFPAGYGGVSDVPEQIKTAIKSHVAFWYENRGDATNDGKLQMPLEVRALYSKFKVRRTFG